VDSWLKCLNLGAPTSNQLVGAQAGHSTAAAQLACRTRVLCAASWAPSF